MPPAAAVGRETARRLFASRNGGVTAYSAPVASLEPGSVVGNYTVEEQIGRGGMGVVYRARDVRLGRQVALKLLSAEMASDVQFRERFLRESRAAASIDHPNVLPIYEAAEVDGELFIAMRYVEGEDLGELLARERTLDRARAVNLVAQVAEALDVVHRSGLVHRDVKPSNVLLSASGAREHAYLTDFGITKLATAPTLTESGAFLGTVDYCAPEVIRGEHLDARADVYSLGCVLFKCLTGEPPFPKDSHIASIYAHLEEEPPALQELKPHLPLALDEVVKQALAKEPEDRFQTAGELAAAASDALGVAGPDDRRAPAATTVVEPREHGAVRAPARRSLWLAVAAVLGVLAAGVVVLTLGSDDGGGGSGPNTDGGGSGATTTEAYTPLPVAPGTTRVGSDLGWPSGDAGYCGDAPGIECTFLQLKLGGDDQAVPADGVITAWSVRGGKGELALRVIAGQTGRRRVIASSRAVQASGSGKVATFKVRIPVRAGQRVGVELGRTGYLPFRYLDERTTGERYEPPLGPTPARPLPGGDVSSGYEIFYNATIEPDRDHDGLGDKTQDRNPRERG
jgi:predicted Ser/Thr protein kinase